MSFPETAVPLARALAEQKYSEPTAVQSAVLAPEAEGRDLLVSAQTGSGKTVAFGLAMGATLLGEATWMGAAGAPLALIVAPTRELALQVQRELTWLYQFASAQIVSCVGGMDPKSERRALQRGAHIIVGTPGRLRDHLERGALDVSSLKVLVLDEADEMLDMGFREDLEFILETTPAERRTLLFSATLPKPIVAMAKHYQRDALRIAATDVREAHADIEYRAVRIAARDGEHAVVNLLRYYEPPGALVFCNTREAVRHLHAILVERGFSVVALSGEMGQGERNQALQALRDGRARICVATDVAARGIDLPSLSLVIHAELPNDAEVMQHRSGRTGRAGKKGISVLLIPPQKRRRAEMLLAQARLNPVWAAAPSAHAIKVLDQERLLENPLLTEAASEEDLELAKMLLETQSPEQIAAALVRLYRANLPAPEELADPGEAPPKRERSERREPRQDFDTRKKTRDARIRESRERSEEPRAPRREQRGRDTHGSSGDTVWFRLNVGRERNADPKWLVPEICNQGGIGKQDIGQIRIFDRDTRFEVNADAADGFAARIAAQTKKTGVRIDLLRGDAPEAEAPRGKDTRPPRGKDTKPYRAKTGDARPGKPAEARHGKSDWKPKLDVVMPEEGSLDDWARKKPQKPKREGIPNWKPRYDSAAPPRADKSNGKPGGNPAGKPVGKPGGKQKKAGGKTKPNRAARRAKAGD